MLLQRRSTMPVESVGLDLSLTGTGVVVLSHDNEVLLAETLKNKLRGMERLEFIRNKITDVIDDYPDATYCVENYAMGSRAGQAFSIGELGGVIKLLLFERGIIPYLVPPTRLKKFITGGGKAEKDMIMMLVYKRWGWEASDNNTADAYSLSKLGQNLITPSSDLNKAQLEVIRGILNPPELKKKKR